VKLDKSSAMDFMSIEHMPFCCASKVTMQGKDNHATMMQFILLATIGMRLVPLVRSVTAGNEQRVNSRILS